MKKFLLNLLYGLTLAILTFIATGQMVWLSEWWGKMKLCKSAGIKCYSDKTISKLDVSPADGQRHLTYYYGPDNTLLYLVWRNNGANYDNVTSFFYPNGELRQEQTSYDNGSIYRVDSYSSAGFKQSLYIYDKNNNTLLSEKYYPNGVLWEIKKLGKTVKYYHPNGYLYMDTKENENNNKTGLVSDTNSPGDGGKGSVLITTKCPNLDKECIERLLDPLKNLQPRKAKVGTLKEYELWITPKATIPNIQTQQNNIDFYQR